MINSVKSFLKVKIQRHGYLCVSTDYRSLVSSRDILWILLKLRKIMFSTICVIKKLVIYIRESNDNFVQCNNINNVNVKVLHTNIRNLTSGNKETCYKY